MMFVYLIYNFITFTTIFQVSFLNGQSQKTLVGRVGKVSSSRFHTSYSFYFFKQEQPRYKGFCTSIRPIYNFITFISSSTFFQVSFLNGKSYKTLVGRVGKISLSSFHTSYSFCIFKQNQPGQKGFGTTVCPRRPGAYTWFFPVICRITNQHYSASRRDKLILKKVLSRS